MAEPGQPGVPEAQPMEVEDSILEQEVPAIAAVPMEPEPQPVSTPVSPACSTRGPPALPQVKVPALSIQPVTISNQEVSVRG